MQLRKHGRIIKSTTRDFNEVVDKGTYYELILTDRKMYEKGRAKIDKKDLKKVASIGRWCLDSEGYVINGSKSIKMHRLIMGATDDYLVDHVKTGIKSKSDNRRKNLRLCTNLQNLWNMPKPVNNTSGYKGVSYKKHAGKWAAGININSKRKHLGYFNTPEEASLAYCAAAKALHKNFAHQSVKRQHGKT